MSAEKLSLDSALFTIALTKSKIFFSSFSGFFVFGTLSCNIYVDFFQFHILKEFPKLYFCLTEFLRSLENPMNAKSGKIFSDSFDYEWKSIFDENNDSFYFSISKKNMSYLYEISFDLKEFNNLIQILSQFTLPCLSLSLEQESFFNLCLQENIETLIFYQSSSETFYELFKKFELVSKKQNSLTGFKYLYLYYFDLILIIKQLLSMFKNPESLTNMILS